MELQTESTTKKNKNNREKILRFVYHFSSIIISIPLSFYLYRYLPSITIGHIEIELFLSLGITYFVTSAVFEKYKILSYVFLLGFTFFIVSEIYKEGGLNIKQLSTAYARSFQNLSADNQLVEAPSVAPTASVKPHVSIQQRVVNKVDFRDSIVRNFAVEKSLLYFDEYYSKYNFICREFSLIKYIKNNFKYVRDPKGFDYFASPVESIQIMGGDCDDHSILLASTIKAIGGEVRFILAPGHIYPELFCGDAQLFDKYVSAIRTLFYEESMDKTINFREENGKYWLNIDYTDKYPGSKYYSDTIVSYIYP
jgi:hypothetical protein